MEGREIKWEGEGGFIICAFRSIFRLLSIQIISVICDWSNVTLRFTSIKKELER